MRDSNNKEQNFDDCFKDHFGDFEAPKMRKKESSESEAEENSFDQLFQAQFDDFEQKPDEKIWNNVQKELPLHLIWRKKLNQLSRIAAVLLIGLFITMLISQQSDSIRNLVFQKAPPAVVEPEIIKIDSDFVYDANPKQDDMDMQEDSKTLFADELVSNKSTLEEASSSKMDLAPLSPLPKRPIEALSSDDASLVQDTKQDESSMSISIPLRLANGKEGKESGDQYKADIMARNDMINPAQ